MNIFLNLKVHWILLCAFASPKYLAVTAWPEMIFIIWECFVSIHGVCNWLDTQRKEHTIVRSHSYLIDVYNIQLGTLISRFENRTEIQPQSSQKLSPRSNFQLHGGDSTAAGTPRGRQDTGNTFDLLSLFLCGTVFFTFSSLRVGIYTRHWKMLCGLFCMEQVFCELSQTL